MGGGGTWVPIIERTPPTDPDRFLIQPVITTSVGLAAKTETGKAVGGGVMTHGDRRLRRLTSIGCMKGVEVYQKRGCVVDHLASF
ncbi:hypothetical protein B296_00034074 [Ensete ventricosum]|uniref:Uncharacterized protein n=1 Tax=Ensete ventricosum TaxID=4639 RepID=A0A426XAR2_ENSVE|nr:hypothetical protein B296_00034074 [Ensete ventricosum]